MNQLQQIFNYGGNKFRTVMIDNEPWFLAKDVCDVLGIMNSRDAISRLDNDEKNTVVLTDGNRGNPRKTIVNESGLYALILSSRRPEAKAFKRWITHEVIPSIRKHDAYMTDNALEQAVNDPDFMIGLLTKLKDEKQARLDAEKQLEIAEPKVEAFDTFLDSSGSVTLTDAAKANGISVVTLGKLLRQHNVLLEKPHNSPAQKYTDAGYFVVVMSRDYYGRNVPQTRVTAAGVNFIRKFLKNFRIAV